MLMCSGFTAHERAEIDAIFDVFLYNALFSSFDFLLN